MAKLIYSAIASLDGYIAAADGNFDWAAPDDEVHAFVNDLERPVGTCLLGRRMYEALVPWETANLADHAPVGQDFARIWRSAEKVVYSRTLASASSARTRIERTFEPDSVVRMKAEADSDLTVGGANLATQAIKAGLVDECHLFLVPVVVGAGTKFIGGGVRSTLRLLDERRFQSGVVYLHYRFELPVPA